MPLPSNNNRRNAVKSNKQIQNAYKNYLRNARKRNALIQTVIKRAPRVFLIPVGTRFVGLHPNNKPKLIGLIHNAFNNAKLKNIYLQEIKKEIKNKKRANAERPAKRRNGNNNEPNLHRQMQLYNVQARMT